MADEENAPQLSIYLLYVLIAVVLFGIVIYLAITKGKYDESKSAFDFLLGLLRR